MLPSLHVQGGIHGSNIFDDRNGPQSFPSRLTKLCKQLRKWITIESIFVLRSGFLSPKKRSKFSIDLWEKVSACIHVCICVSMLYKISIGLYLKTKTTLKWCDFNFCIVWPRFILGNVFPPRTKLIMWFSSRRSKFIRGEFYKWIIMDWRLNWTIEVKDFNEFQVKYAPLYVFKLVCTCVHN